MSARKTATVARWFGPSGRPLMGWLTAPESEPSGSGVLLLAPVGYEWWSSHRTLRTIAERLAASGHVVLRFDYEGTGDSAGGGREPGRVGAWRADVGAAAAELRGLGCNRLTVLGVRLGGLLALFEGARLDADAIVAWAPPASGKRLVRELRMLTEIQAPGEEEGATIAGVSFDPATLAELADLDPKRLEARPAPRVGLVGSGTAPLAERLRGLGAEVAEADAPGGEAALAVPSEDATVPEAVVDALIDAVGEAEGSLPRLPSAEPAAEFEAEGGRVREEVVAVGPRRLVAVLTAPAGPPASSIVVWLNSGSEPHVGPGRAWVEYARALAGRGHASLRLDFSGWGESPDLGHAPGRPYDAHGVEEAIAAIDFARERGFGRVTVAGLCAGAWIALKAVLERPETAAIALNPQLYWQPGDPVEALMRDTRIRRTPLREREERGARFGLWTLLDRLGARPAPGAWLDALAASRAPVLLCFAEGDDGLEYLENRLSRRLDAVTAQAPIEVVEIPDIDHSMHRFWFRDRILAAIDRFLTEVEA